VKQNISKTASNSFVFSHADINECDAIPGLCEGGKCLNTIGSFTCECPAGQARDLETNQCTDRDECQEEGICADGRCINTNGGYYCHCNPGFIQSQDRRYCIGDYISIALYVAVYISRNIVATKICLRSLIDSPLLVRWQTGIVLHGGEP